VSATSSGSSSSSGSTTTRAARSRTSRSTSSALRSPASIRTAAIAFLLEHRRQAVGDEPIDLGAHSDLLYVGTPAWDVGTRTISGAPERIADRLNELGAMGVSHVQVRFRSRDLQEHLDQIAAFGAEVMPLLHR